jgi:selenide,water dikinase
MLLTLPANKDPRLLVGLETSDDAGVYKLTDEIALIMTADFITPPVDDPFQFGQIAAANSISDVYAMGGTPFACLNLVSFPSQKLEPEVLNQIVAGALDKITEAGAVLAGGHSIDDDEPKFGLAVNGLVHPDNIWKNSGARPGDKLILTKPLGSAVIFNANLKKLVSRAALDACIDTLSALNRTAAETARGFDIHAATDVTGFGLAGHVFEMARGSGVCIFIDMESLPIMDQALEMYQKGVSTAKNAPNREQVRSHMRFDKDLPPWHQEIVFDPQTSGGLLLALPASQSEPLCRALKSAGVEQATIIGSVESLEDRVHLVMR